jgi:hypothetical protein
MGAFLTKKSGPNWITSELISLSGETMMNDKENKSINYDESSIDFGTLMILNKGTNQEQYLWSDGEQVLEIGELPEDKRKLFLKIILAEMDQTAMGQN